MTIYGCNHDKKSHEWIEEYEREKQIDKMHVKRYQDEQQKQKLPHICTDAWASGPPASHHIILQT